MTVRVRFAPSPTGRMHIGNVRAALLNFLFARQKQGTFILRVEDTDAQRNQQDAVQSILRDLSWSGMTPDEGPGSSENQPYFQSQRTDLYTQALAQLVDAGAVYPCFCSSERLEKMRETQRVAGHPPRYDGLCRSLSNEQREKQKNNAVPFIYRFAIDQAQQVSVPTLADPLVFDMQHFGDFAITRADQSFTFIFTNAVDDIDMEITHIIRGSDHLSNTALQAVLYAALGHSMPVCMHLPLLASVGGKKLSKRDFGFSLHDVQRDGIVPEALQHYLLTVGGTTIDQPLTFDQLLEQPLEPRLTTSGHITYDIEALRAINRMYVHWLDPQDLYEHMRSYEEVIGSESVSGDAALVEVLQKEVNNLEELCELIRRVSCVPSRDRMDLVTHCGDLAVMERVLKKIIATFQSHDSSEALQELKRWAKLEKLGMKVVLGSLRYAVIGRLTGIGMAVLLNAVTREEILNRLQSL